MIAGAGGNIAVQIGDGGVSLILAVLGFSAVTTAVLFALFGKGMTAALKTGMVWTRLIERTVIFCLTAILLMIVFGGAEHIKDRWLTPILLPASAAATQTTAAPADAVAVTTSISLAVLAGGAAIIGHLFPVWLKFKGGKGVATGLGTLLAINWMVGIGACLTWLVAALLFRYSSLSALLAFALAPFYMAFLGNFGQILLATLAAILVWLRHHENIGRLLSGTEPKIGRKKPAGGGESGSTSTG